MFALVLKGIPRVAKRAALALKSWVFLLGVSLVAPQAALACGGFFCSLVPINQAAEQIVFKKQGSDVTAIVQIQYTGEAENFSWVVPVPGVPTFSVGSNLLFQTLEPLTRPSFNLQESGEVCLGDMPFAESVTSVGGTEGAAGESDVDVIASETVGPFDIQVIRSEDPDALATWLTENNYDLSDRGEALIEPYVSSGMNFVVLKLSQGRSAGDVQPLVMNYQTEQLMIPIRLTAVAAEDDMGILVWLLGDGRAVPTNYPHVTVNYSQLDWFHGPLAAYSSYQQLVADAMDEAGGQGFVTDYAGTDLDVWGALDALQSQVDAQWQSLSETESRGQFVALAMTAPGGLSVNRLLEIAALHLPLPDGVGSGVYMDEGQLQSLFTEEQWQAAREVIEQEIFTTVVMPVQNAFSVFENPHYLTRLYTRLSAEEMTLDPTLAFNLDMAGQDLVREASLVSTCLDEQTQWSVTLGEGTDREGERIMEGIGLPPTFFLSLPVTQSFLQHVEQTLTEGDAEKITQNEFETLQYLSTSEGIELQSNAVEEEPPARRKSGGGGLNLGLLGLLGLMVGGRVLALRRSSSS